MSDTGNSTTGRNATLTTQNNRNVLTGFSPAPIQWLATSAMAGNVDIVDLYGGQEGNTFKILGAKKLYAPST